MTIHNKAHQPLIDALQAIVHHYYSPNLSHEEYRVKACHQAEHALAQYHDGRDALRTAPSPLCDCGDPDCLKGAQLFTPEGGNADAAGITADRISAGLYETALARAEKLGYGTVVEALFELERRQTDIPKPVEVAKVISLEGGGKAIALHPDFKHLRVGSRLYTAPVDTDTAVLDVMAERRRQIGLKGWTPEHDDQHAGGEMASAAGCYAVYAFNHWQISGAPAPWPWEQSAWKPGSPRRNLVKAAALLIAEIQRLDRMGNPFQSHVQEDAQ